MSPRWVLRAILVACAVVLLADLRSAALPVALAAVGLALALEWTFGRLAPLSAAGALVGALAGTWTADHLALGLFGDLERLQPFVVLVGVYAGATAGLRTAEAWTLGGEARERSGLVLDTSALIDGRIAGILASGLVSDPVVVPGFVLRELQHVADSHDPSTRARGRRGLETLERLRGQGGLDLRLTDDSETAGEVDDMLVRYAARFGHRLVTLDLNLSKVASLRGVPAVHLHELSSAFRRPVLPGETVRLLVVRAGRERDQGVAYLEDGTMVVIEGAAESIGRELDVVVTSAVPSAGGILLFARAAEPQME